MRWFLLSFFILKNHMIINKHLFAFNFPGFRGHWKEKGVGLVNWLGNSKKLSYSTVNAALEAARDIKSPLIIQFSQGGSAFFAGKGLDNKNQEASIVGAVAGAEVNIKEKENCLFYKHLILFS